jgi:hypothetical protein
MNEFQKHLFKLNEVKFSDYNLNYIDSNNEDEEGVIVVVTNDFEKAFAFKPYNRIANKNSYLVIEEETDLEAIVKQILGEDNFCNLPNLRQFHNGQLCRYLKIVEFSSYNTDAFTHLKTYLKHNFEETEDDVKHYELFDKNIVIVPKEFYDLAKEKVMPAA